MLSPIRPSVTRVNPTKTVEVRIMKFPPRSSPIPLVFREQVSSRNSEGFPRAGALNEGGVGKIGDFQSGESVALLVARRTNNRKVVGSRPAEVVCIAVLAGNRLG